MADRILSFFPTTILQRRLEGIEETNRQLAALVAGIEASSRLSVNALSISVSSSSKSAMQLPFTGETETAAIIAVP